MSTSEPHAGEAHTGDFAARLNWLRAGVLGANDGIVSTASIVVGVAGASSSVPAIATAAAFSIGAVLPLLAILLSPEAVRVPVRFVVVLVALALTGAMGARIGGGSVPRATARVVVGAALALAATFLIGSLLGTSGVV